MQLADHERRTPTLLPFWPLWLRPKLCCSYLISLTLPLRLGKVHVEGTGSIRLRWTSSGGATSTCPSSSISAQRVVKCLGTDIRTSCIPTLTLRPLRTDLLQRRALPLAHPIALVRPSEKPFPPIGSSLMHCDTAQGRVF